MSLAYDYVSELRPELSRTQTGAVAAAFGPGPRALGPGVALTSSRALVMSRIRAHLLFFTIQIVNCLCTTTVHTGVTVSTGGSKRGGHGGQVG